MEQLQADWELSISARTSSRFNNHTDSHGGRFSSGNTFCEQPEAPQGRDTDNNTSGCSSQTTQTNTGTHSLGLNFVVMCSCHVGVSNLCRTFMSVEHDVDTKVRSSTHRYSDAFWIKCLRYSMALKVQTL